MSIFFTKNCFGEKVAPHVPINSGGTITPSGKRIWKEWRREERKRKLVAIAKDSPGQALRPAPKGMK